jgi:hypothetical protein
MNGILTILSGQVRTLAEKQGVDPGRLDIESHMDQTLDYRENPANLVKQFGIVEVQRPRTVSVSREEVEQSCEEYKASLTEKRTLQSVKAQRRHRNPTFKHLSKELWQITAAYSSLCGTCRGVIHRGDVITMFQETPSWSHIKHAHVEAAHT